MAKPGRSIVLTTHSMEEADALSDRIGIMAYGSLRCLGSSLHLKAKFGAGHKIDLVVRDGAAKQAMAFLTEMFASRGVAPPQPHAGGPTGEQFTLQMPQDAVALSELFEEMERRPEHAGIVQWALRQTSMEEVFLRIARDSEARKADEEERAAAAKKKKAGNPCQRV